MFEVVGCRRAPEYVRLAPRFCDCVTKLVRLTYLSYAMLDESPAAES
ncbi:hypothetical protein DP44_1792 [Burkholderia pseudomallei]|nr:hypothetical protein DP44_1792 [Burkholderia pseudomallei]